LSYRRPDRARIFKLLRSPGIESKESIPRLCSLAGRYYDPIPTRFPASIDCLKIPAQTGGIDSLVLIPGLLKSLKIPSLSDFMGEKEKVLVLDKYAHHGLIIARRIAHTRRGDRLRSLVSP
jgi:hypothetical protein